MDDEEDPEHSQGPAPAPLDLGRLEVEAKLAAAKHVASLLQVSGTLLMRTVFIHLHLLEN